MDKLQIFIGSYRETLLFLWGVLAKVIGETYNLFTGNRENPIRIKCILQGSKSFTGIPCNLFRETFAVCKFMQDINY